jgi:hypothetical protein
LGPNPYLPSFTIVWPIPYLWDPAKGNRKILANLEEFD